MLRYNQQHEEQQTLLSKEGFYFGRIDGLWGNQSRKAMTEYCRERGYDHLVLDRHVSNEDATISRLRLNGRFQCHVLEDQYREQKVYGETRIPAGTYAIELRKEGGFHSRYQRLFGNKHFGMLHLRNVPGFKYILIHVGNYHWDTEGCLLVGRADYKRFTVWQSKNAYVQLYRNVWRSAMNKKLLITIEDNDL